jgi:hypothetical protein
VLAADRGVEVDGRLLAVAGRRSLVGTSGRAYRQGDAVALEPEHFTDSPDIPAFPSTTMRPGDAYVSATEYRFASPTDECSGWGRRCGAGSPLHVGRALHQEMTEKVIKPSGVTTTS